MAKTKNLSHSDAIGCGYLLKLTLLISILMIVNSYIVGKMVAVFVRRLPDILDDVRLYQFFQVFLPILIVCIQFWIYDRIKDHWLRARGTANDPNA